ncbi:simple sugar transport system permease protein [Aminobacter lissarensis]|uniref:Simple sugar transport system permease protein n=1 Tax=Aminobacter carboxidus TaxID=376165 RepID=A0A8E2BDB9_9HYPH|nr:ABC transporter permease [Aminobacter lissarensis]MBB6468516.1 simple sugar transport system permease protein [Aminobacter lissarensis]
MIRFEPRVESDALWTAASFAMAIAAGLAASAILLASTGADVLQVFSALLQGAVGSPKAVATTLVKATPIILTGLATVIAFRAQLWSIGQEGQVFAGAMGGYLGAQVLAGLPPLLFFPGVLAFGMTAGMALGSLAAVLKNRFGVNEIISTVMLNYLVVYLLSWLLQGGPWGESGGTISYHQSPMLPDEAFLPGMLGSSRLHAGVLLPFLAAAICGLVMSRTPLGYEIRGLGYNPEALRHKGVNINRTVTIIMLASGALGALAGAIELFGVAHRLRADNLIGLGYAGIIVGMIGGLRPLGTVFAGLFFGGLASGAVYMRVLGDVPAALVPAMQGITLFFFLCAGVVARYRVVRVAVQ